MKDDDRLKKSADVLSTTTALLIKRTLRIAVSKQVITSRQATEITDILFAEIDKQVKALK